MKSALAFTVMVCALALPARAELPRPDPAVAEFARGVKFTVAGYTGTEVLTNFPVLVRLSESAISGFTYSDFYADGSDLSLVDIGFVDAETNGIPYEIDTWNTNGESLVWVNLPLMTNGTEFVMWYRSSKTGKELNSTNVWTDYTGVWHLNESGSGGDVKTTVKDSSTNSLDSVAKGRSESVAEGRIGGSWRISNVYDRKEAGLVVAASVPANNAALKALGSTFHVSFWFKTTSTGDSAKWCALVGRRGSGSDAGWALQLHDTWNQLRVYGNGGEKNAYRQIGAMNGLNANIWAKIDAIWYADNNGKGRATVFYNGTQIGDNAFWKDEAAVSQIDNLDFVIGNFANLTSDRALYGEMDEVRLGAGKMSAARVKADYDTVNKAAFLTAGSVVEIAVIERPVANLQVVDTGASHIQFGNAISSLGSSNATECVFNVKVWKTAESEPAGYTALATGLTVGALTGRVKGLTPETAYSYKIKVTNDEGVDSDEETGSLTTSGVGVGGTGGDMTRVGDDWIHYFHVGFDEHGGITNAYVFTPPSYATVVRALVVGGGGPGGYYAGGGGGAGGYYSNDALGVTPGAEYSIHVGAGGAAATSETAYGSNGGNSSIVGGAVNIVMLGGGAGGNGHLNNQTATLAGQDGGSGGGTAWADSATGSGKADQGHDGGTIPSGQWQQNLAAGGGGASAVGGSIEFSDNDATKGSGVGGNGRACDITGESLHYAGGGSGGAKAVITKTGTGTAGAGGDGGGGKGGQWNEVEGSQYATAGADGFGGGGGGGSTYSTDSYQGGNGGDGIVIIRYAAQGDGTDVAAPAIALESLDRAANGLTTVGYRVAWAGAGYEDADVKVVWGFRKDELTHTNDIASAMIGRGTGTFTLEDQTETVYVRALATNAGGVSSESPKIVKIPFVDPQAPEVALPVVSEITGTNASFSVVVLGLGEGAHSVTGVFQVCTSEEFDGTILSFPADEALSIAGGSLTATATGLAPNTPYYVRVSATNDVPAVFETDPVAFRTAVPGPPSGLVITANPPAGAAVPEVTTTTIDAWGQLTTPGDNGATHANLCLEASTTSDFASIDATSTTVNGLAAGECASFSLTDLEPETAYYLRLHMENDGRVVAYSSIVGPFTTLRPIVNLTIPDLASYHVTLVSVTTNDVAVVGNAGVYTVFSNATVVATFAAESGYRLVGGATVDVVMDANKTLTGIPTAELIPPPPPTVTLTIPDLASYHMTLVSVTTNDVEVVGNAGVYTVFSNDTVVATFAAELGYRLEGDAAVSVVMDANKTFTTADMPTAEFITEASAPEVSQSATKVSARKTITLMATAAGATSYIWLKNGVQIEGGTSGTLTVNWRKPNGNPIDTYQAVAVYSINDLPVESEPSARMTVENLPMGTIILVVAAPPAPPAEHDYSADYLTFRVLTSGTISWKAIGSNSTKTIDYSIDNGAWISITSTSEGATISVTQGNLVRFRGSNNVYATDKNTYSGFEGGTATYDIEGNIMSLLYGDNFAENTALPNNNYIFCSLFKKAPVISAEHLILPATMLKDYCYRALFSWCETLTKAPALPATTLATGCYWYMFEHCAITEAPVLNATTLVSECYGHMFTDCGLLNKITCLATSGFGTSKCLEGWVTNVAGDGAFVKTANVTSWTTGVNGIPSGWIVCEDVLLLPPEVSFYGDTIELECPTEGAEIHYRLGQTGDFALYTGPISIVADTVVEAYSTYQGHTSPTVSQTCVYVHETPFQKSNKDLPTWRYGGNTITTPYSVNAIDGHSSNYSKGTFSFETSITLQSAQPTYLWFQHADQSADIYVNDVKVGTHWGGYNAFFFDISEYVRRGRNDIRVALSNNKGNALAPAAGDFNFNATLGNVKLFTSPVLPAMEYGYDGFHITSSISASSATTNATIYVETKVPVGADLKCIISDDSYAWTNTLASTGSKQIFTTTISNAHLWNGTLDPHLYTVTLEIRKGGDLYHKYERPYGFRYYEYVINNTTVIPEQSYTGFLLNGQPYLLRGVCMHDDVEGKANALTDSDYDQEFAIIQELGCNFIRLAHYPHPKEVYDRCDRLGIVVQTEVPCVNKLQSTMPEDYYTHLTTQYIDMVEQHFNHPCIMFWGLSNETTTDDKAFGKEKIEGYYDLIKSMDTERMVGYVMSHSYSDPSGYYNNPDVDWFGCNLYVGWYIDKTINDPSSQLNKRIKSTITDRSKPLALSEYGCGGTQHCHSTNFLSTTTSGNNPRHDIEYQMWLHEGHIAAIRNYPQLLFTGQWQLFDIAVSSRKEGYTECLDGENATTNDELKYLNNKGLVERDHVTKKDTFYIYKAEWNSTDKFVHICGKDYTKTTQRKLKCYTNDGDTLAMYIGDSETPAMTATVTDHIAVFTATNFPTGVEIQVKGATTSDTVTFQ